MTRTVDARGLSCPQPVMVALAALAEADGPFRVEVDHETAAENVERACREKGRATKINTTDSGYAVEISAK